MLTWGFLLLVGGFLSCLIFFLSNVSDIFAYLGSLGFGGYVAKFFDPENLTTAKIVFVLSAVLALIGLVVYIIGRVKNKGEKNPIVPANVKKYLRDTRGEFKKIVWPNFPTVMKNTGVVLAMCAVTAAIICLADAGLSEIIALLLGE